MLYKHGHFFPLESYSLYSLAVQPVHSRCEPAATAHPPTRPIVEGYILSPIAAAPPYPTHPATTQA